MKSIFARHGIPETVISDNGPQFSSKEFADFAAKWEFSHITSNPRYPKANGMAERTVQTVKQLLEKADLKKEDPYLAILTHRAYPDPCGDPSPAEKLMNRQLRTRLPAVRPPQEHHTLIQLKNGQKKRKQAFYHDKNARELPKLNEGSTGRVYQHSSPSTKANWSTKATVIEEYHTPRSYVVRTDEGQTLRRNRSDLRQTNENSIDYQATSDGNEESATREETQEIQSNGEEDEDSNTAPPSYTTRYGRVAAFVLLLKTRQSLKQKRGHVMSTNNSQLTLRCN